MADGGTLEATGRSVSADPPVTGEDFAEYFAGGLVDRPSIDVQHG